MFRPQKGHTVWLCPAIAKDKRNWRLPENKASTTPAALREIPDYHGSGNKTETVGSVSDYYCFFFSFLAPQNEQDTYLTP